MSDEPQVQKIAFDDFFTVLGACLFDEALLVSNDNFEDLFPHNLKRGKIGKYSILMSSAKAKKEDAEVIQRLRFGLSVIFYPICITNFKR